MKIRQSPAVRLAKSVKTPITGPSHGSLLVGANPLRNGVKTMDPAFADTVSSCATAFAVIAVLGALLIAVVDANNPHNARVRPSVVYLAALGIVLFLFGHAIRYRVDITAGAWHPLESRTPH